MILRDLPRFRQTVEQAMVLADTLPPAVGTGDARRALDELDAAGPDRQQQACLRLAAVALRLAWQLSLSGELKAVKWRR